VPPHFTARRSFFLASIVVLLVVGGAELVVRLVGVEPPPAPAIVARTVDVDVDFPFMRADAELFWAPRPGFRGEFLGRPVSINGLGLRGPEVAPPQPSGRRRVACFGDSITFGYGVADDETYAARLGAELGGGFEVVNAGVTGYTSHQVRLLLRRLAPALRPDVATFCVGWNDASRRPVDDRTYARRIRAAAALDGVARHVHLYRAAKGLYLRAMMRRADREWDAPPAHQRVPVDQYRENLRGIVATCRRHGVEPVFLALPRRRRAGEAAPSPPPHVAALDQLAAELKVPLVAMGELGLDTPLPSNERYFIDNLHLSAEGNRYLAKLLAPAIRLESRAWRSSP
jgi:lysophospholipase L1-like esterase